MPRVPVALAALAALQIAGCEGLRLEPIVTAPAPDDSHLPPARVNLPTVPRLDLLERPRTLADGSVTVAGLLLDRETIRDTDVHVTGIVQEIYRCEGEAVAPDADAGSLAAPAAPAQAAVTRRSGCLLPHLYIVDNMRSDDRMLVTGYDAELYEPQIEVGGRYVFEGRYTQRAPGFMSTEYGLLDARRITGDGIEDPAQEGTGAPGR